MSFVAVIAVTMKYKIRKDDKIINQLCCESKVVIATGKIKEEKSRNC